MDGSLASREALVWAGRLVRVLGGRIVVVHALDGDAGGDPIAALPPPDLADRRYAKLTEAVELDWCRELVRAAIRFSTVVRSGHPLDVIPEAADLHQAGLVIVGNRGRGPTPALGLGSTTQGMLGYGDRPVLVAPEPGVGQRHLALRQIVVSADGSAASERALGTISDLAVAFGSRITLVRARGPRTHHGQPRPRIDARLPRLARRLSGRGIPVRTIVRGGDADAVVSEAAADIDADLVAVGAGHVLGNGYSGGRGLAAETHRPTLVVPAPASCPRMQRPLPAHSGAAG